jgi:hypothetical protein
MELPTQDSPFVVSSGLFLITTGLPGFAASVQKLAGKVPYFASETIRVVLDLATSEMQRNYPFVGRGKCNRVPVLPLESVEGLSVRENDVHLGMSLQVLN